VKKPTPLTTAIIKKELVKQVASAVVHHFKKGDPILQEGQESDSCFYLVKGRVNITKRVKRTNQVKIGSLGAGQFFGEMAMLSGERRSATVTAATIVEVIEIARSEFETLTHSDNPMAGRLALHFSVQLSLRIQNLLKLLAKHGEPLVANEAAKHPIDVRQVLHKVYSFWAV
jgi:CRP-like cAMP-binding protein